MTTHLCRHTPEISLAERPEQRISNEGPVMRILIATDAWHPQVNGVVRTLTSLARSAAALGAEIDFLTPDGFPSLAVPTYPGLRIALPNPRRIADQDRGGIAGRHSHRDRRADRMGGKGLLPPPRPCFHDVLYDTLSGIHRRSLDRSGELSYAVLRHFHAAGAMTMIATAFAAARTRRARFRKARHLDPRRRYQAVHAGSSGRA